MKAIGFVALSLCLLSVGGAGAVASEAFSKSSEIIGIGLSVPGDSIKAKSVHAFGEAAVAEVHASFKLSAINKDVLMGYVIDATSPENKAGNDAKNQQINKDYAGKPPMERPVLNSGDRPKDFVRVGVDPNPGPHPVLGITRYIEFPKEARPPIEAITASLIEKYGRPSSMTKDFGGTVNLIWRVTAKPSEFKSSPCELYGSNLVQNISAGDRIIPPRDTSGGLVYLLNSSSQWKFADAENCGLVLKVEIAPTRLVGEEKFAARMNEYFIDFVSAYSAINKFNEYLHNENSTAEKGMIDKGQQYAPKL